jgi:hypothetical protein
MSLNAGVVSDDLQLRMIAKERVRQLQGIGKRLLGKWVVCADPENLDVQLLEFLIIDLPGRQVLRSRRTEIVDIKLKENVLPPPELAQADLLPGGARKCEIRGVIPNLKGKR